jgi:hypothetical protein
LRHGFVEELARIPDTRCALLLPTPQNASGAGDSIQEEHALAVARRIEFVASRQEGGRSGC